MILSQAVGEAALQGSRPRGGAGRGGAGRSTGAAAAHAPDHRAGRSVSARGPPAILNWAWWADLLHTALSRAVGAAVLHQEAWSEVLAVCEVPARGALGAGELDSAQTKQG